MVGPDSWGPRRPRLDLGRRGCGSFGPGGLTPPLPSPSSLSELLVSPSALTASSERNGIHSMSAAIGTLMRAKRRKIIHKGISYPMLHTPWPVPKRFEHKIAGLGRTVGRIGILARPRPIAKADFLSSDSWACLHIGTSLGSKIAALAKLAANVFVRRGTPATPYQRRLGSRP